MIDTIVRVYRYLLSYTKRYHGDLYVLVLDKYAETFPAQTRGSGKGCRAKQIALRRVRTCGLYKSVLELWYAKGHSSKRLQLDLGMQGGRGGAGERSRYAFFLCGMILRNQGRRSSSIFTKMPSIVVPSSPALGRH